jgi:hypothetical protein
MIVQSLMVLQPLGMLKQVLSRAKNAGNANIGKTVSGEVDSKASDQ